MDKDKKEKRRVITMWTIYKHPTDYPDYYVVRACEVFSDGSIVHSPDCSLHETLWQARESLPPNLYNLGRMKEDDPVIKESWI